MSSASLLRLLAPLAALALGACVTSQKPLFDADSRALPFASPARFEVYEREGARGPWKKGSPVTLTADASLVVKPDNGSELYTFHPLGEARYIVQGRFGSDGGYSYGFLTVRDGEAILSIPGCKTIDQAAFRAAGGTIAAIDANAPDCRLGSARDPVGLLKSLAKAPPALQRRFVPIR